jgi:hypothetical protein
MNIMIEMQKEDDNEDKPVPPSEIVESTKNPSSKKNQEELDVTMAQTEADFLSKSRIDQIGHDSNASLSKIINFDNSTIVNNQTINHSAS